MLKKILKKKNIELVSTYIVSGILYYRTIVHIVYSFAKY